MPSSRRRARRPDAEDALTALANGFLEVYADWREQRELMQLEAGIRAVSAQVKVRSLGQQVAWESLLAWHDRGASGGRAPARAARAAAGGDDRLRGADGQRTMARGRREALARRRA
ncbi:MAG: hypothetical protein IPK00_23660 [Deltaproteobacteria bacterium]|nr:hypothetical protein [Deltaproteobacteria bacterium]